MKDFKDRLAEIMAVRNISMYRLSKDCGISPSTVSNWLSGNTMPDKTKLYAVSKYLYTNIGWLINGDGNMLEYDTPQKEEEVVSSVGFNFGEEDALLISRITNVNIDRVKEILKMRSEEIMKDKEDSGEIFEAQMLAEFYRPRIPLTAAAGTLTEAMEGVTLKDCEQIPIIHQMPSYDFTIYLKGDSLYPKYESGDEVACKRIDQTSFIQWGKLHVLDTSQGIVAKRIYDDGNKIRCVSYNPDYPDFSIDKKEIYSINLVVGLIRI